MVELHMPSNPVCEKREEDRDTQQIITNTFCLLHGNLHV